MPTVLPHVSDELVAYLRQLFPDCCPNERMSEKEVWMAAGSAKVVRKLAAMLEEQRKARNIIEGG